MAYDGGLTLNFLCSRQASQELLLPTYLPTYLHIHIRPMTPHKQAKDATLATLLILAMQAQTDWFHGDLCS